MCKPIGIGEYIKGRSYMAHEAVAAQPVNADFSVLYSVALIALALVAAHANLWRLIRNGTKKEHG